MLRSVALPDDQFGEGLALVDDRLIQLTWQDGIATAWDAETFEPIVASYAYEGEGWGLCYDGERLVMSDGSDTPDVPRRRHVRASSARSRSRSRDSRKRSSTSSSASLATSGPTSG